jgi:hypothetical protein
MIEASGLAPDSRAIDLTVEEWVVLMRRLGAERQS